MRNIFTALFIFILSLAATAQVNEKITFSEGVFNDNTSWSICVADAITGEIITDKDAGKNMIPASIMKLVPTAAALTLLGDEYRFTTTLAFTGTPDRKKGELNGNIYIIGGGDPMFCSPYFRDSYGDVAGSWVKAIRDAGIRKINGSIIADASLYDYQPVPGGWEWEDIGNYYGAGVHGINYNDNMFSIYITGGKENTVPVIDSTDSFCSKISITNNLISYGSKNNGYVYSAPYSASVTMDGPVPEQKSIVLEASLPDPPLTVAGILRDRLIASGIPVSGEPLTKRTRVTNDSIMEVISATLSPDLGEMILVTNNESMNLYATQLSKHLGLVFRHEGTYEAGMDVLGSFIETIGCDRSEIRLADAAGLSRNNAISTAAFVRLLTYMYNSPGKDVFIASLPVGGVSGTMKNSFRDEVFKGRIVAKTGSMTGVKSLAGYVTTSSGKVLAFAIMVNGFTSTNGEVQEKIEEIIREIILNY